MSTLTDAQVVLLAEAAVLVGAHASVLSDFELETLAEVGSRFGRFRRNAIVTVPEWEVFHSAVEALRQAQMRAHAARDSFLARTRAA